MRIALKQKVKSKNKRSIMSSRNGLLYNMVVMYLKVRNYSNILKRNMVNIKMVGLVLKYITNRKKKNSKQNYYLKIKK